MTRESCTHWRVTFVMTIDRLGMQSEFRRRGNAVPGTKRQAIAHLRKVYERMWPSAKIRLVACMPDRQAEAKEAREVGHA